MLLGRAAWYLMRGRSYDNVASNCLTMMYCRKIFRFFKAYTPLSLLRMVFWRAMGCQRPLHLYRSDHSQIELRGGKFAISDRWIASEIFIHDQYFPPFPIAADAVHLIIDVGANVGYSIVYFSALFPDAQIVAFEPHPAHVSQIRRHLRQNGIEERVTLHAVAAGTADGAVVLSDSESTSSILPEIVQGDGLSVPLRDWFALLPEGQIDILKMDIEGAEFALMSDQRFEGLARRTSVMSLEWHNTPEYPDAHYWCAERLTSSGFTLYEGSVQYDQSAGTLWAMRR